MKKLLAALFFCLGLVCAGVSENNLFAEEILNFNTPATDLDFDLAPSGHVYIKTYFEVEDDLLDLCFNTGSYDNILTKRGIKKIFGTVKIMYKSIYAAYQKDFEGMSKWKAMSIIKRNCRKGTEKYYLAFDGIKFLMDPVDLFVFGKGRNPLKNRTDGVLGLAYMTKYDNVVVDYQNMKVLFNQEPVSDFPIIMKWNAYNNFTSYYIPFYVNGLSYFGQINTGAHAILLSDQLVDKQIKTTKQNGQTYAWVNDFRIADKTLHNIQVIYKPNKKNVRTNKSKMNYFQLFNFLGYPAFKDSKIQLDFKNGFFMISK